MHPRKSASLLHRFQDAVTLVKELLAGSIERMTLSDVWDYHFVVPYWHESGHALDIKPSHCVIPDVAQYYACRGSCASADYSIVDQGSFSRVQANCHTEWRVLLPSQRAHSLVKAFVRRWIGQNDEVVIFLPNAHIAFRDSPYS